MTAATPPTTRDIENWLRALARALGEEQHLLDELDAGAGDGDHGATMVIGFRRVVAELDRTSFADRLPEELLRAAARAFAGVGGSIGPLWAAALLRAARTLDGRALDGAALAQALRAAAEGMAHIGSARRDDRTLLDAMYPAADAFAASWNSHGDLARAAAAGLRGALDGAAATRTMIARRGRASRNAALAGGRVDAGAASVALAWTTAVLGTDREPWRHTVATSAASNA
ncbi:DAK2 domain-containing protein [Embleya hyalina]|uniref:Dihydroxyacetone kinase subunit L n=1 Tax=Embleya hyalina TaxID=516124 RepID=A0A401YND1_9ACTN|nr:DAK2 domain-containing protein [Embleya hyalina]GCD96122.1 dihydroxyacetone kinase subunit L [Embleya hyalina]